MRFNLETQTWAASVLRQVRLSTLPPGHRVRKFLLTCNLTGTLGAADTMTATNYSAFIVNARLAPRLFDVNGVALQDLQNAHHGRITGLGANVGAPGGGGGTFDVTFVLELALRNERQIGNDDGSINTGLLMGKSLELQFAAAAGVLDASATVVITGGTIRIDAECIEGEAVPQFVETGYFDPGSQTVKLDPGIYLDLYVQDGAGVGSVTPAEVTQVDLFVDGKQVLNNITHAQLISAYNNEGVLDAAAELGYATPRRLPIIWQNMHGKGAATKQPAIETTGLLQLSGTLVAPRIVYRRIALKDQATVDTAIAASGAPAGGVYEPAVASKSAVRAMDASIRQGAPTRKARLMHAALPGKMRLTPTPGGIKR